MSLGQQCPWDCSVSRMAVLIEQQCCWDNCVFGTAVLLGQQCSWDSRIFVKAVFLRQQCSGNSSGPGTAVFLRQQCPWDSSVFYTHRLDVYRCLQMFINDYITTVMMCFSFVQSAICYIIYLHQRLTYITCALSVPILLQVHFVTCPAALLLRC